VTAGESLESGQGRMSTDEVPADGYDDCLRAVFHTKLLKDTVEAAQTASVEQIRQVLKSAGHDPDEIALGGGLDRPAPASGGANR
jgi:hypothetical protein